MNISQNDSCFPTAEFQFYLFPAVYGTALVFGLFGNLFALYVFTFRVTAHTSSIIFVVNLALADTAFLCTLPFRIHYHVNSNDWVFGDLACRITGTLFFANIYISIAFLTCICIDRYIATVHPHTYLRLQRTRWSRLVSLAVWLVTGAAAVAFIVAGPLESDPGSRQVGQRSCFENFSEHEWSTRMVLYSVCSFVFGSLVPFVIIMVCYPVVARRIARIHTATSRRALRIICAILTITVICFLPYHVVHLLHLLMRRGIIQHCAYVTAIYQARRVTVALVSLNSCLDPVLYYFTTGYCKWASFRWLRTHKTKGVYIISKDI
ncbi:lysophosphatidic acid receptor 6-like [Scleropages formosus]|uniref:Lysophosphatidic acid receptor 6-like n=1 Tax=Scleropages formosus TaxID=113540 RepID=A0A0P7XH65_SCLFO|nr:lysophosphatidic acid receptor 6-like [Scleropages formosus]KPP74674.1 lysophosphatidic acid receptor 6-like [Scleropages formosus]